MKITGVLSEKWKSKKRKVNASKRVTFLKDINLGK